MLWNAGTPYAYQVLPANFSPIARCPVVSDYSFVLSKFATPDKIVTAQTCNRTEFLQAGDVVARKGCFVSVVLVNATALEDVDAAEQQAFSDKMGALLKC